LKANDKILIKLDIFKDQPAEVVSIVSNKKFTKYFVKASEFITHNLASSAIYHFRNYKKALFYFDF